MFVNLISRGVADAGNHFQNSFPSQFVTRIDDDSEVRNHVFDDALVQKIARPIGFDTEYFGGLIPVAIRANDNASDTKRQCLRAKRLRREFQNSRSDKRRLLFNIRTGNSAGLKSFDFLTAWSVLGNCLRLLAIEVFAKPKISGVER